MKIFNYLQIYHTPVYNNSEKKKKKKKKKNQFWTKPLINIPGIQPKEKFS